MVGSGWCDGHVGRPQGDRHPHTGRPIIRVAFPHGSGTGVVRAPRRRIEHTHPRRTVAERSVGVAPRSRRTPLPRRPASRVGVAVPPVHRPQTHTRRRTRPHRRRPHRRHLRRHVRRRSLQPASTPARSTTPRLLGRNRTRHHRTQRRPIVVPVVQPGSVRLRADGLEDQRRDRDPRPRRRRPPRPMLDHRPVDDAARRRPHPLPPPRHPRTRRPHQVRRRTDRQSVGRRRAAAGPRGHQADGRAGLRRRSLLRPSSADVDGHADHQPRQRRVRGPDRR